MRIVTSEHFAADPERVQYCWAYATQVQAHMTLDALDDIADVNRPPPAKGSR